MGRYVVPEMVAARYGPLSDEQSARLPWLIDDVEAEVGHGRDLPTRIAEGRTSVDVVVKVICELVNDELRNPLKLRSATKTTGAFTDQQTFAGDNPGEMTLSRRQSRLLGDPPRGGAFTITPGGGR